MIGKEWYNNKKIIKDISYNKYNARIISIHWHHDSLEQSAELQTIQSSLEWKSVWLCEE